MGCPLCLGQMAPPAPSLVRHWGRCAPGVGWHRGHPRNGRELGWTLSRTSFPLGVLQSSLVARTEGLDQQVDWNW